MTDASLEAVETVDGQTLGAASIGEATLSLAAPTDAEIPASEVAYAVREIQAVGRAEAAAAAGSAPRAVADGNGRPRSTLELPTDTARALLKLTDAVLDDVDELLGDQEAVDELGLARDELAAAIEEDRTAAPQGGRGA